MFFCFDQMFARFFMKKISFLEFGGSEKRFLGCFDKLKCQIMGDRAVGWGVEILICGKWNCDPEQL